MLANTYLQLSLNTVAMQRLALRRNSRCLLPLPLFPRVANEVGGWRWEAKERGGQLGAHLAGHAQHEAAGIVGTRRHVELPAVVFEGEGDEVAGVVGVLSAD